MRISIIGSFRKYYTDICKLITQLQITGHTVLSPANSVIVDSVEDFVIFDSDAKTLTPHQIQTQTLNKILKSDIVYVFCPEGYVGRTTCYEIGVLRTTNIPLIFSEMPKDLPIYVDCADIVSHFEFPIWISRWQEYERKATSHSNMLETPKSKFSLKKVIICGSMAFYDDMEKIKIELAENGIPSIIPKEEDISIQNLPAEEFTVFKRRVSMQYLSKIRENSAFAILVVNNTKNGKENYIGTNTLVEISMAFCWGRPIFLYNDMYIPMQDELEAWNATCLRRNLDKLIKYYRSARYQMDNPFKPDNEITGQLCLEI